ncbi:MAG TPA: DUF4337 domain-containing protein [Terracidiphilus sp.]|nr:DUF4337 domain-containing protein [Terracidiphilus sp.]
MEANEAQELQEHAEHGAHESALRPVAFTMSVLAVLVAVTTVLGHRTHTEAVLDQNRATDQWNLYQAKKIRASDTQLAADMLGVVSITDKAAAGKVMKAYADHEAKWNDDLKEEQEKAEALEAKVELAEKRAGRFDLGEALLEIGLVITSVTLLTRRKAYWYFGLVFSLAGVVSAASAYLLR